MADATRLRIRHGIDRQVICPDTQQLEILISPGWLKHSIWDSQLAQMVQVLDDGTLILVRHAYSLLDVTWPMISGPSAHRLEYAYGGLLEEHLKNIWIAFRDADAALNNLYKRSALQKLSKRLERLDQGQVGLRQVLPNMTRRQGGKILDFIAYLIPIISAMYWFPRYVTDVGPMPWGFILTLFTAVMVVIMAEFLKE